MPYRSSINPYDCESVIVSTGRLEEDLDTEVVSSVRCSGQPPLAVLVTVNVSKPTLPIWSDFIFIVFTSCQPIVYALP
jgi:hypothetical protein